MMFLKELFGPKWKSRKADVRLAAVGGLDAVQDREVLASLASTDPQAGIRLAALRKLRDVRLLRERLAQDAAAEVRAYAAECCARALCGQEEFGLSLDERLAWLSAADAELIERAALEGRELELRRKALDLSQRETLWSRMALSDPHPELRLAALARIGKKSQLERIWKESRTRDKRVAREAKARLDALEAPRHSAQGLAECLKSLAQALEALAVASDGAALAGELEPLERRWAELQDDVAKASRKQLPDELPPRVERALVRARKHQQSLEAQAHAEAEAAKAVAEREQLCLAAERLRDELRSEPGGCEEAAFRAQGLLDTLLANWRGAPVSGEARAAYERRFRDGIAACERVLLERPLYREALSLAERLLAEIAAVAGDEALDDAALALRHAEIKRAWAGLPKLKELALPAALSTGFAEHAARIDGRLAAVRAQAEAATAKARRLLGRFESLLNAGRTRALPGLLGELEAALAEVPESQRAALARRHDSLRASLESLQGWRIWAALPRKQALCAELEALAAAPLAAREQGARLRQLQASWRSLGATEPEQDTRLEARYAQALELALAPVKRWREAEEARMAAVDASRAGLCEEAEALAQTLSGAATDWRVLDLALRELNKRWNEAGHLPAERWAAVHGRFRAACRLCEQALRQEQAANTERKAALVAEAEQLAGQGDARAAADGMKALQQRWKTLGRAAPKAEAELWARFRAAADGVFAERQKHFEARRAADQELEAQCAELCERLEALAASAAEAAGLQAQVDAVMIQWPVAGGRAVEAMLPRWRAAQAAAREAGQRLAAERLQAELAQVLRLCELCAEVELAGGERRARAQALAAAWAEASAAHPALAASLAARWREAAELGDAELAARAAEAMEKRAELALLAEILAELDSPEDCAEARMRLQVSRLAERLRSGKGAARASQARALLADWCAAGPLSAAQAELDSRFRRAQAALFNL